MRSLTRHCSSSSSSLSLLLSSSHEVTGQSWYRHHPPCRPRWTRGMPPTHMGCQKNAASPQACAWPRSEEILQLYHPRRPCRIRCRLCAAISAVAPPPQHLPPGDYCVARFPFHRRRRCCGPLPLPLAAIMVFRRAKECPHRSFSPPRPVVVVIIRSRWEQPPPS